MRNITLEELLEAGCHFGHQVTRQNPKARDFVFEARDNIHIIDLAKTKEELEKAAAFVKNLAKNGGSMIVLGAKRQAENVVKDEVKRAQEAGVEGIYFVTQRWIGGILTNFTEITKNFKRLEELTSNLKNEEEKAKFTKKEISLWEKERIKLISFYGGIATMKKIPDAVFIIDTHLENLAVREARATGVATVGITDTNSDPTLIDYPIPANDDAVGSILLITSFIIDAWIEGSKEKGKADATRAEAEMKADKKKEAELEKAKLETEMKITRVVKDFNANPAKQDAKTVEEEPTKKATTTKKKAVKKEVKNT